MTFDFVFSFNRFQTSLPSLFILGTLPFLPRVFGDLMQGIYIDVKNIIVFINDANRFLPFTVVLYFLQPAVHTHAMIDMRYIIAGL